MRANVADLRSHLSEYLGRVERGEEVEICRRNIPVAVLVPVAPERINRTRLGCDPGSAQVHGDLTEPALPESDWHMLTGHGP